MVESVGTLEVGNKEDSMIQFGCCLPCLRYLAELTVAPSTLPRVPGTPQHRHFKRAVPKPATCAHTHARTHARMYQHTNASQNTSANAWLTPCRVLTNMHMRFIWGPRHGRGSKPEGFLWKGRWEMGSEAPGRTQAQSGCHKTKGKPGWLGSFWFPFKTIQKDFPLWRQTQVFPRNAKDLILPSPLLARYTVFGIRCSKDPFTLDGPRMV